MSIVQRPSNITLFVTEGKPDSTQTIKPVVQVAFGAPLSPPISTVTIGGTVVIRPGIPVTPGSNQLTFRWVGLVADTPRANIPTIVQEVAAFPKAYDGIYPTTLPFTPTPQYAQTVLPLWSKDEDYQSCHAWGVQVNNFNRYNTIALLPDINTVNIAATEENSWEEASPFTVSELTSYLTSFDSELTDTSLQWFPVKRRRSELVYGQGWHENAIYAVAKGDPIVYPTATPAHFGELQHVAYPNDSFSHSTSHTRSVFFIGLDSPASTVDNPQFQVLNNGPDSFMNLTTTHPGTAVRPTKGHFYAPFLVPGGQFCYPWFPIPPAKMIYNCRGAQSRTWTSTPATTVSITNQYDTQSTRTGLFNNCSASKTPYTFAPGLLEEYTTYGTCDFPKNCSTSYGHAQIMSNNVENDCGISPFPEGYAIRPRHNYTARMAHVMEKHPTEDSYCIPKVFTTVVTIPPGRYTPDQLAYQFNLACSQVQDDGQYPFVKALNMREEDLILTATEYFDDRFDYADPIGPNTVFPFSTEGRKGRAVHAFAGNNGIQVVGSSEFGIALGPQGYLQFSGAFDTYSPPAGQTTTLTANVPSVFRLNSSYQRAPWDPPCVGNYGQPNVVGGAATTPDPVFMSQSITVAPYYLQQANHIILESIDRLSVAPTGAKTDGIGSPDVKSQLCGRTYSTTSSWAFFSTTDNNLGPFLTNPVGNNNPGNDIADSLAGNMYCQPCGATGIPGPHGMQLLSIGDGSDGQNALLKMMGFDPEALSTIWEPEVQHFQVLEGCAYLPGSTVPTFSKDYLPVSNLSPDLYNRWSAASIAATIGTNPSDAAFATYMSSITPSRSLNIGTLAVNQTQCLDAIGKTTPTTITCPHPMYQNLFDNPLQAWGDLDVDTYPTVQLGTAVGNAATPPASLCTWNYQINGLSNRAGFATNYGWPMQSSMLQPLKLWTQQNPSWACTTTDHPGSWNDGLYTWDFLVGHNVYNVHSPTPQLLEIGYGPSAVFTPFTFASGTQYTFIDYPDDYAVYPRFLPGSYGRVVSFMGTTNAGTALMTMSTCCNFAVKNHGFNTQTVWTETHFADLFCTLSMALPSFDAETYNVPASGPVPPPRFGPPQEWSVYIQGHTDLWFNGMNRNGSVTDNLWTLRSPFSQVNPTLGPPTYTPQPITTVFDSYSSGQSATVSPYQAASMAAGRIPRAGVSFMGSLGLVYTNQQIGSHDNGLYGMISIPDITAETTPADHILRTQLHKIGREPNRFGVVTNWSPSLPQALCYPSGPNSALYNDPTTGDLTIAAGVNMIQQYPFSSTSNVDASEPTQIQNPSSKVMEAGAAPASAGAIQKTGLMFVRVEGFSFDLPTELYINGQRYTELIPLQVDPDSNNELNLLSFNSDQTWTIPAQYISSLRFTFLDSDVRPLEGVTNIRLQVILSEVSTGSA